MAAAEYYNPGGQQHHLAPPRPAASTHGNMNPPYPLSDAPPPYSELPPQPRPHSQPPPHQRPPQPNDSYRPPPPNGYQQQQYPPEKSNGHLPPPPHNMYRPSDFGGQPSQAYPPQQYPQPQPQGYFPLAGTPAMQQVYGNGSSHPAAGRRTSSTPLPRPPRSPRRDESSRERSRSGDRHRRHHHNTRPQVQRKKSSGVNTFLGAGGGAIIGDAIFPGLGTLGGAILGGLGGHEYGKRDKRTHSNPGRTHHRSYSNSGEYYQDDYRRGRK